ncbi:ATP synthase F1 subunit delta [Eubacterium oxidoreducens]|uniref:ATP synthase subunit delta n=1 Tax=Eubacterium oxidoreducens TaxID=1732 RepID=A0A1G6CI90_EUBOX|nr:ATP synthase F1 subunit delta [Eubacterium oxidoreducens]SDB32613.1 F-type H+-transporting ATPase subunit delta [Eubacterium oxidoreducens]
MTQAVINYATVLFEAKTPIEEIKQAHKLCEDYEQVKKILSSPAVHFEEKKRLVEKLFPESARALMATLCKNGSLALLPEIVSAYQSLIFKQDDVLEATFYYVTKPTQERIDELKDNLCKKYHKTDVSFTFIQEPELVGGFMIRIGNREYDYSLSRQITKMRQVLNRTEVK